MEFLQGDMVEAVLHPEEKKQVGALRSLVSENLTPDYDTDFNLLRWIQGHPGPIEQVASKLNAHLKTRASPWFGEHVKKSHWNDPIYKHWPCIMAGPSGVDEDTIVVVEQWGLVDFKGILQTYSLIDCLRTRMEVFEDMLSRMMQIESKTGRQAFSVVILDLTGLRYEMELYRLLVGPMRYLAEFVCENYVEVIKYFVFVNTPVFINALWTVAKSLLPARTLAKTRLLSSSDWRNEVLNYSSADILPDVWNRSDCEAVFANVVPVPLKPTQSSYWIPNLKLEENLEHFCVSAGKSMFITRRFVAGESFEVRLESDADFGFGFFFTLEENDFDLQRMTVVFPSIVWVPGPTQVPLRASMTSKKTGYYRLYISNERAWFHTLRFTAYIGSFSAIDEAIPIEN